MIFYGKLYGSWEMYLVTVPKMKNIDIQIAPRVSIEVNEKASKESNVQTVIKYEKLNWIVRLVDCFVCESVCVLFVLSFILSLFISFYSFNAIHSHFHGLSLLRKCNNVIVSSAFAYEWK